MKLLLISTNYSPELTGIGKYSGEMAQWLAEQGHEVRVVCAPPYYPEWQVHAGFSGWKYKKETSDNLTVYRCPIWVPKKVSGLKRLVHLASFAASSLPVVLRHIFWRADVVFCVEPPLFNSFGAIVTAKLSGAKSVLHIQDFEVDAAFELGIVKAGWLKKFIYGVERFLMRRFDRVSTISLSMMNLLDKKQIDRERQLFFPNWVDTSIIHPLQRSSYRNELNIADDQVVCLYSGNMGLKQGLEIIIDAAELLENEKIVFLMAGFGAAVDVLKGKSAGIEKVVWLPLQPFEKLNEFLNVADIHLLPQQAGAADLVMPSKLTGMLSSGRSIVATADEGTEVHTVLNGMAEITRPGDVDDFAESIKKLAKDADLRSEYGIKNRYYAEQNLNVSAIMQRFENELNNLLEVKK
ncbi:glycosyltransferase WbuB [Thiomicrorhabdus sp. 6S2-11]|uniref:Glycosyltransferase WbuB n=1 Tax=Thiomicrorhabdus marina TaxID=2818442 RepID=A0ABS3Q202_9GAMM|nr:glycosyltransferase WbuB [Thiomicrorhabdus marina]MBO1926344.1 glycosyltransferase WbuB [Thiomicrorhabdus marina]